MAVGRGVGRKAACWRIPSSQGAVTSRPAICTGTATPVHQDHGFDAMMGTMPPIRPRHLAVAASPLVLLGGMLAGLALWTHVSTRTVRFPGAAVGEPSAERRRPPAGIPATEWGLVLGAEVYPSGDPSPSLRARLDLALELFRAGAVRRLIVSGDEASNAQVTQMARYLVERGVPAGRIVVDEDGIDTYASCRFASTVPGLAAVTVISQDYHLPRALTICRSTGLEAYGVGDSTLRHAAPWAWRRSVRRELVANVKMLVDLAQYRYRRR